MSRPMLSEVRDHFQELFMQVYRNYPEGTINQILVDVHGHWIPNIDDGVKTIADALQVIEGLMDLGFKKLIATPHINNIYPENDQEKLVYGFYQVVQEVSRLRLPVKLGIAAEYMLDSGFYKHISARNLMTLDDKLVLFELPSYQPPPDLEEIIFELQLAGYKPLLAHPERYSYFQTDLGKYEKLKEIGCLFQLNALSIANHQNEQTKNTATKLLNCNWYEFLGTDIHTPEQLKYLSKIKFKHSFNNNDLL